MRAHLCEALFPEKDRPPFVWGQREAEGELLRTDEAAPFLGLLADLSASVITALRSTSRKS